MLILVFEAGCCYVAQAVHKLTIHLPPTVRYTPCEKLLLFVISLFILRC
jgi:hypothetical protein